MKATGIIMAGGKSSRMGTNKALLKIGEATVIEKIVAELQKTVSNIIIVTNKFEDYEFLDLPMVKDIWTDMGPLAGIHAGLHASTTVKNLVVACDMPFISAQLGDILLRLLDEHDAAVPRISGQLHPLFAAYRKEVHEEINQSLQREELRIRLFFQKVNTKIVTEEDLMALSFAFQENYFFNMNDPGEFEKALQLASDQSKESSDYE
ncbi:molybdopterin-guanine dinucleotide biosynthesis protein A [Cytobacillus eiseniae]|uniref:Probable molybdenum cofactor guanylyltransferase n=1 Tax=Cytobacillus eiseniae TaxID=762947 RepID=A0ABS4RJY4_9BACI|nr:molybdenum cofactor guanylyltransferase [Cytobacillus eiseniae]MBP2243208.1 molybdopterin-guanine dinucleotide biosynthesis protein A [Cytobacillus eiseniae]